MDASMLTECLMAFGLTRQEAVLYLALTQNGTQTGYEIAKITGISRSNAYNGLSALAEKGAAYVSEDKARQYTPVEVKEFCENKLRSLAEKQAFLLEHMPKEQKESEGYITIRGEENITDKILNMLDGTKNRIYLSMSARPLKAFLPELGKLIQNGIKVVILTNKPPELEGGLVYLTENKGSQIGLITDSSHVLTGELAAGKEGVCLYSGQKNFVKVFKDSLKNEIKLIELQKDQGASPGRPAKTGKGDRDK